ncbi:MAG: hypothetical protein AAGC60_03830 [Acidobacteriota bacterium]
MRIDSTVCATLAALLLLSLGGCRSSAMNPPDSASAVTGSQQVSWLAVGGLLRDADAALEVHSWERAESLYLQVADGRPRSDSRRAKALWGAAIAEIAQPAAERELGLARARLDALLTAYPERDEAVAARALRDLLDLRTAETEPAVPPPVPPPVSEDVTVESDAERALRLQVARLERELAEAEAALAEKEAALETLKQAIVGDG